MRWRAEVELMEELAFDSVWLPDALGLGGPAPLPILAAVAVRTERLKLGTAVLSVPARSPVLLAQELATIDVLSDGRLLPAGGLGVRVPAELRALGIASGERVARLEESIAIIKALWPGEPVSYEGRFWSLDGIRLTPRPKRQKLEFWLGGRAPAMLERIGRIGDGWLASATVTPQEFRGLSDVIRASALTAGRSIDEDHYGATVFAAPSRLELEEAIGAVHSRRLSRDAMPQGAVGASALRVLLSQFVEAGASKFVVFAIARDGPGWLRELHREVVEPLERGWLPVSDG
jgi:probable F420-dependent oxidoreductase